MTKRRPGNGRGTVSLPDSLSDADARQRRENAALEEIEARMKRGALSPIEAEREILELALARFDFLPDASTDTLRSVGLELLEEPEFVESRSHAPGPHTDTGDEK